jgi:hypothetical protein
MDVKKFRALKRQIIGHARALESFYTSARILNKLLYVWESNDVDLRYALYCSAIIGYSKPFTESQQKNGDKRTYKVSLLKKGKGFSGDVHDHIIEMRNKIFAHSDEDFLETKVFTLEFAVSQNGDIIRFIAGAGVTIPAIHDIKDHGLVERFRDLAISNIEISTKLLEDDLNLYLKKSQKNPEEHRNSRENNNKNSLKNITKNLMRLNEVVKHEYPIIPEGHLEFPPIGVLIGSYQYRLSRFFIRGNKFEFELSELPTTLHLSDRPIEASEIGDARERLEDKAKSDSK